jgi:hypothetical protein
MTVINGRELRQKKDFIISVHSRNMPCSIVRLGKTILHSTESTKLNKDEKGIFSKLSIFIIVQETVCVVSLYLLD